MSIISLSSEVMDISRKFELLQSYNLLSATESNLNVMGNLIHGSQRADNITTTNKARRNRVNFHWICWHILLFLSLTHFGTFTPYGDIPLKWRHDACVGVSTTSLTIVYSTADPRRRSKKTSKLRVSGLCVGDFPAQRASDAENVYIWWRHHGSWLTSVSNPVQFPKNA